MDERERDSKRPAEAVRHETGTLGRHIGPVASERDSSARSEEAERIRFRSALDEVMSDHHTVLAALAK